MTNWNCDDWQAFHDHMPGKPRLLRVIGTCHAPSGGWEFSLQRKEPQGINPKDLLLLLNVVEPDGASTSVLSDYPVEFVEETEIEYDTVTVVDVATGIEVQHTY